MLQINKKAPELKLPNLDGSDFNLHDVKPDTFTMLVGYRGYHCPICKKYLTELNTKLDDLKDVGVDKVYAFSADPKERAEKSKEEWDIENVNILYNLDTSAMKDWGLYISTAIKDSETDVFSEPAVFLIDSESKVYSAAINSMPFARPHFDDIAKAVKFVKKEDYPSRGRGI